MNFKSVLNKHNTSWFSNVSSISNDKLCNSQVKYPLQTLSIGPDKPIVKFTDMDDETKAFAFKEAEKAIDACQS